MLGAGQGRGLARGADQPLLCWASLPEPGPSWSLLLSPPAPPRGTQPCLMVVSEGGLGPGLSQDAGWFPHYLWQA